DHQGAARRGVGRVADLAAQPELRRVRAGMRRARRARRIGARPRRRARGGVRARGAGVGRGHDRRRPRVMSYEHLGVEPGSPVTRLVLDRPERRNALSLALMREMLDALDRVAADPAARVLVIQGNGPAFSAGHDLAEILGTRAGESYAELFGTCV